MQYLNIDYKNLNLKEEICLTIGNFDGIHNGHNKIIEKLNQEAKSLYAKSAILSFDPHPNFFFNKSSKFLINSKQKKIHILEQKKIDYLIDLYFNQELTRLSYNDFQEKILFENLKIKKILIGNDFRYGHQRMGNIETLKSFCEKKSILFENINLIVDDQNTKISSTQIRDFLSLGKIKEANKLLENPFSIKGLVKKGDQRGRTIGIPTANIDYPENIIQLPFGVYAVKIKVQDLEDYFFGIVNFGIRPTFDKSISVVEAHFFDFDQDIYEKDIEIFFEHKIRDEKKFNGIKELLNQITLDINIAKEELNYGN
jgi:riboflavin kinase/FMN adenylyltransferase